MCQPLSAIVLVVQEEARPPDNLTASLHQLGLAVREARTGPDDPDPDPGPADLVLVRAADRAAELCARLRARAGGDVPLLCLAAAGPAAAAAAHADLVLVETAEPVEVLAAVNTLLRLRRDRQQARRARQVEGEARLEAVGRLAGGVAHDFNNLLTVVNGYSELLLEDEQLAEAVRGPLAEIRRAGERAAVLTRQLLAFSRRQTLAPHPFALNEVVAGTLDHLRRALGGAVEVTFTPGEVPCHVMADPERVEDVLTHLALFARDAMPQGGRFTLATSGVEVGGPADPGGPPPGRYALLRVSDTGHELPPEALERLFEPFFTTRDLGRGEGLGLAVVHGIVRQSGGRVEVQSEPGQGTTFLIALPCAAADAGDPTPPAAAPAEKSLTVLMVEDEAPVRGLVRTVLEKEGYRVLEAAEAAEAERVCRDTPGVIDLLLTDMVMPGADGRRVAERLVEIRPGLKVLLMSGFLGGEVPSLGPSAGPVAFLPKPFTRDELRRKVREVLGEGS